MGRMCLSHASALEFWRHYRPHMDREGVRLFGPGALDRRAGYPEKLMLEASVGDLRAEDFCLDARTLRRLGVDPHRVELFVDRECRRRVIDGVVLHSTRVPLPRNSILSVSSTIDVVSPELCLVQMAAIMDEIELIQLCSEFCGFYSLVDGKRGNFLARLPLTSAARLGAYSERLKGARGLGAFGAALPVLADGSASPRETAMYLLLCLPRARGGYGLPKPDLNKVVSLSPAVAKAFGSGSYVADMVWGEQRVIVEYDGLEGHTGRERMARDASRRDALAAEGYVLFVVTNDQILNRKAFEEIAKAVARKLGVDTRIRSQRFNSRHDALREAVFGR